MGKETTLLYSKLVTLINKDSKAAELKSLNKFFNNEKQYYELLAACFHVYNNGEIICHLSENEKQVENAYLGFLLHLVAKIKTIDFDSLPTSLDDQDIARLCGEYYKLLDENYGHKINSEIALYMLAGIALVCFLAIPFIFFAAAAVWPMAIVGTIFGAGALAVIVAGVGAFVEQEGRIGKKILKEGKKRYGMFESQNGEVDTNVNGDDQPSETLQPEF